MYILHFVVGSSLQSRQVGRRRPISKYALNDAIQTHQYDVHVTDVDACDYIRNNIDEISHHLKEAIRTHRCIKWFAMMDVAFQRTTVDGDVQRTTARFRTQPEMLLNASDVTTESMTAQFLSAIENFNKRGSNWLIERILDFCIMLGPYRPALASPCVSSRPPHEESHSPRCASNAISH